MPGLSNFSHCLRTSKKVQFTCPGTRTDFIALAKKNIQIMRYIFSYFSKKTPVVGTH